MDLKFGLVFFQIHTSRAAKVLANFKNAQANLSRGTYDMWQNLIYWHIYM